MQVAIGYPDASAVQIEAELAETLEKTLAALPGSEEVTTTSRPGRCVTNVRFQPETDAAASQKLVRETVQQMRESLPADIDDVEVSAIQERTPLMTVDVYGELSAWDLLDAADAIKTKILRDLPDFATAEIAGNKEMRVVLERSRMAAYDITAQKILDSIRSSQDLLTPETLSRLEIEEPVLLKDIATVSQAYSGPVVRTDGTTCIAIEFYAPSGDQAIAVAKRARQSANEHRKDLPENVRCRVYPHVVEAKAKPIRLSVVMELSRSPLTKRQKEDVDRQAALPLARKLKTLDTVESVRSIVTERSIKVELTFAPTVELQTAIQQIRNQDITLELPDSGLLPAVIEPCPPVFVGTVDVFGSDDLDALADAAAGVSERLRQIPGVGNVETIGSAHWRKRAPRATVDKARCRDLSISIPEARELFSNEMKLSAEEGVVLRTGEVPDNVRVFYEDADGLQDLSNALITTKEGHVIPLSAIMSVDLVWQMEEIVRVYGRRTVRLNIHSDGTRETAELTARIQDALDAAASEMDNGIHTRFSPESSG